MFEPLGTPLFLADARKNAKWRSPVVEILIFLLVYLIAQSAESVLVFPYLLFKMLSDPAFYEVTMSDNANAAMAYTEKMISEILPNDPVYYLVMLFSTAALIAAAIVYCKCFEKRSFFSMGLSKSAIRSYPVGILVGLLLFAVSVGFSAAFGAVKVEGLAADFSLPVALAFLVGFAVQGFAEELFCRGYLMVTLGKGLPLPFAIITGAFAFMGLHGANPGTSFLAFLNLFLFGVFMSLYMIRTGNLLGAAAIHTVWNFAEGVLTSFPVSGMPLPSSVLSVTLNPDKAWIHGGAFGPEGGIAVTFVLVLGIAILGMMKSKNTAAQDTSGQT